jgi:hypothetical protein
MYQMCAAPSPVVRLWLCQHVIDCVGIGRATSAWRQDVRHELVGVIGFVRMGEAN